MKQEIKKIIPSFILTGWRKLMMFKRYARRYQFAAGKEFIKEIKTPFNSFKILINPVENCCIDDFIARNGIWEPEIVSAIEKYLPKEGVFVDVGANVGYHSLFAASLPDKAITVFAFEPQPKLCSLVERSVQANNLKNIKLFQVALSDKEGYTQLNIPLENVGGSSLISGMTHHGKMKEPIAIETKTLDSFADQIQKVDVMKIDVEGFEFQVLQGASNTIKQNKPIIILEFSPVFYKMIDETISGKIINFFEENNYRFEDLNSNKIDLRSWIKIDDNALEGQIDIVCLPK